MEKVVTIIICTLLLAACNRNDEESRQVGSTGKEYFPLKKGSSLTYAVDSIVYDDNGPQQAIDTFNYHYKEEVGEAFTDDAGLQAVLIHRYFRNSDSDAWVPARNYTAQVTDQSVQRVEENVRFVKLVFPLRERNTWNGNLFNNRGYQGYRLVNYKTPYLLGQSAVSSIRVQQSDIENFIEEIRRYEVFAENIGMVELLYDSLNTQSSGTRGFRYRLKLTSYTE